MARLAPGGIQRRNPCPSCATVPALVVGRVLGRDPERNFLVCWQCRHVRRVAAGEQWQRADTLPRRRRKMRNADDYDQDWMPT